MKTQSHKIVIISSGLVRLATAAVLLSEADITILERGNPSHIAGGQAIGFGSNAVKILEPLGFDRKRAEDFWGEDHNADWLMYLRADARAELLRLAMEESVPEGIGGKTPILRYETAVRDIDLNEENVVLANGETLNADFTVDMLHLNLRSLKKRVAGRLHECWDHNEGGDLSIMRKNDGSNRAIITYPCRDFNYVNFSCAFSNDYLKGPADESSFAEGDPNEALEIFKDFPQLMLDFMQNQSLGASDHSPLPRYIRGRAALIGDAAHSIAPFQGQGTSQAIEDAEGFSVLLKPGVTRDHVPGILEQRESVRRPRASQVQLNTRLVSAQLTETKFLAEYVI
ncbi:FAD/NAD(P)-binding domain-containing protein [Zopfia rhizophila CBS 207.26]|uniref:FAD/NAD(P)-binding domain-containing protein n=1 Tax=Zopfia rhizophila CBS 207.26 TaxID=1314779 RepID=A0A6A6ENE8_9PEZI|nr:FAD/NAD(P)-binding domain-containing protein [Zopfia rhizophila CBS 207.26]